MNKIQKILLTLFTIGIISTVTGCSNDDEQENSDMKKTEGGHSIPKKDTGVYREK